MIQIDWILVIHVIWTIRFECFYAQPFVLAAERELISKYRFDISYTGNCYREETDFMLSLFIKNKKIYI